MKNRIQKILDNERLTPSAFADKLGVGRAVISHILNGRNNPSLDVITRILEEMDTINPDWLLTGGGDMYRNNIRTEQTPKIENRENIPVSVESNLFSQPSKPSPTKNVERENQSQIKTAYLSQSSTNTDKSAGENKYRQENIVEQVQKEVKDTVIQNFILENKTPQRRVNKIIVYYNDNTFEVYEMERNNIE